MKKLKHKTKFVAFVASSADGIISLKKQTMPDWTSKEDWSFFQDALRKMEARIVGRKTYLAAKPYLQQADSYVFSGKPKRIQRRRSVKFLNPSKVDLISLFSDYKNVAVLGGARVYGHMLNAKLLDEIYITIEPLLLGRGRVMLGGMDDKVKLKLLSTRKLNAQGSLLLHYKILY